MSELSVLVVGAGPVGLTLASELRRHGVTCRIVDKLEGPEIWSKAAAVSSRTMEVFQDMGVVDELRPFGREMYGANVYNGAERIAHFSMQIPDTPFSYIFGVSQRDTELALAKHLVAQGIEPERSVELLSFTQDAEGVQALLRHPSGQQESVRSQWLVGCDGAKSTVRHQLDLPFEGSTHPQHVVQADIRVDFPFPVDPHEAVMFTSVNGPIGALPLLSGGRYRLIALAPPDPEREPSLELFEELIAARAAPGTRVFDPAWMVKFKFHGRIVPRYRVGRVFLAGDAGHIHSPVGGQGMNLGIQDAYNLAWKLALVVRGYGREHLLDSYDAERRPIGKSIVDTTDRATKGALRMMSLRSKLAQSLRTQLISLVAQTGLVESVGLRGLSGINVGYPASPIVGEQVSSIWSADVAGGDGEHPNLGSWYAFHQGPGPGQRVSDIELDDPSFETLFDLLRGTAHVLLLFDGAATSAAGYRRLTEIVERVKNRYPALVRSHVVVPSSARPGDLPSWLSVLGDPEMRLHQHFGCGSEGLYLIRPDNYVAFRSQPADPDPISRYLEHVLVG